LARYWPTFYYILSYCLRISKFFYDASCQEFFSERKFLLAPFFSLFCHRQPFFHFPGSEKSALFNIFWFENNLFSLFYRLAPIFGFSFLSFWPICRQRLSD
jgi:hypothetical protein